MDDTMDMLRRMAQTQPQIDKIKSLPSREDMASDQVRQEIVALAEITVALFKNSQDQRATIEKAAESADKAATAIYRLTLALVALTLVLVALTYLLLAEVVEIWPF